MRARSGVFGLLFWAVACGSGGDEAGDVGGQSDAEADVGIADGAAGDAEGGAPDADAGGDGGGLTDVADGGQIDDTTPGGDADTSLECAERPFPSCEAFPGCILVSGVPKGEWCTDPSAPMEALGCTPGPVACDVSGPVCATHPLTGVDHILAGPYCGIEGWASCEPTCDVPDCAALNAAQCQSEPACTAQLGWALDPYCDNEFGTKVFAGCEPRDPRRTCGEAETCGESPQGIRLVFPSTCLPAGWEPCPTDPCATSRCAGAEQAVCASTPGCIALVGVPAQIACATGGPGGAAPAAEFFGCTELTPELVCPNAPKCAQHPTTGVRVFFQTCMPPDWLACPEDPCGAGECTALPALQCQSTEGCSWLSGYPAAAVCGGAGEAPPLEGAGCGATSAGCDDALTCGVNLDSGTVLEFTSSCMPPGWQMCQGELCEMAECAKAGALAPSLTYCVRGTMQGDGTEKVEVGDALLLQMRPAGGCWSSSCTEWPVLQCALEELADNQFAVAGAACAKPTGDEACTPDCGGAFTYCAGNGTLQLGTNFVFVGEVQLSFQVPSVLPFGGLCTTWPME